MPLPLSELIRDAFEQSATDVFLREGEPPRIRREGDLVVLGTQVIGGEELAEIWRSCGLDPATTPEADASWQATEHLRLRVNFYHTLGRLAAVLRPIRSDIPPLAALGLPAPLLESWMCRRYGLILITGPTGSGKSTTVASCLDWINHQLPRHIVTLEDPIEYLFKDDLCLFSQREIRQDTASFASALRSSLRQSPDIIFLGEIRDAETALTALHAAETGHLVLSTVHSSSVAETIERFTHLIDANSAGALNLLATQLVGIISQQLLPRIGGGLLPALEYMQNEAATRRWIVDGRLGELQDYLRRAGSETHCSLLDYLVAATQQGFVDAEVARAVSPRPQDFDRALRGISN
jgi:pilus retraction protein PilT